MLPSSQNPHIMGQMPRRTVLRAAAVSGLAALGWESAFRTPAAADAAVPPDVDCYTQAYRNWSGEIKADDVPTCSPRTVEQVVSVVNWAHARGLRVRPAGMRHGWAPLTITDGGGDCILIDLTGHLTSVSISADEHGPLVTAQTGVTMTALLTELEEHGYGFASCPAPGDLSLGGVLAIDGHGTAVAVDGAAKTPGQTFGTVSNLIVSLTAVVWDESQQAYVARTYLRSDSEMRALLVHLGRALIVQATLRVAPNQRLRCVSRTDLAAQRLFAPPAEAGEESFAALLEGCGRIETIWFPYTQSPWLKLWSVAPEKPPASRETVTPFNYPFSDEIPQAASDLLKLVIQGDTWVTPLYAQVVSASVPTGLAATDSADLWGWAKNTQLYVRPTTLRVTANGYAVLTKRENIQEVVSKTYAFLTRTLEEYQSEGNFPMNGPWEVRVTGLDDAADCLVAGAREGILSAVRPRPDRGYDTAVWLDVLTLPGTPSSIAFYRDFEQFLLQEFDNAVATAHPEWSKGWAYGANGAWTSTTFLHDTIPAAVQGGHASDDGWNAALAAYDALDPHGVYGNPFLDVLMG
ncbi:FAD-binding protein [Actinospica sp. MGRD01-02]|uniref:FAD-binding protein n=1 Tax=Actinospica acidithermotolerans TaxID=2828514 RepID=A0A941EBC6_9ACTN|nr:cholesterol oxidase substrate-binding domain-containing protein [Actinospica acidithermotolerans]MBR7827328.1 FAD-binding protein [Actinospica acidithermotolerans]